MVRRHLMAASAAVLALMLLVSPTEAQRPEAGAATPSIQRGTPISVGMSAKRLERITQAMKTEVDEKKLPGAVVMVARKGRLVYAEAFGLRDPKGSEAMRADTIFRIYSMTKPLVSVAAMLLVEDGVIQLTDPVAKFLPATLRATWRPTAPRPSRICCAIPPAWPMGRSPRTPR